MPLTASKIRKWTRLLMRTLMTTYHRTTRVHDETTKLQTRKRSDASKSEGRKRRINDIMTPTVMANPQTQAENLCQAPRGSRSRSRVWQSYNRSRKRSVKSSNTAPTGLTRSHGSTITAWNEIWAGWCWKIHPTRRTRNARLGLGMRLERDEVG